MLDVAELVTPVAEVLVAVVARFTGVDRPVAAARKIAVAAACVGGRVAVLASPVAVFPLIDRPVAAEFGMDEAET